MSEHTDTDRPAPAIRPEQVPSLLHDLLDGAISLPRLAAFHDVPITALLDWLEDPETEALLSRMARAAERREELLAPHARQVATAALTELADHPANTPAERDSRRKAAQALLIRSKPHRLKTPISAQPGRSFETVPETCEHCRKYARMHTDAETVKKPGDIGTPTYSNKNVVRFRTRTGKRFPELLRSDASGVSDSPGWRVAHQSVAPGTRAHGFQSQGRPQR